tara:strand:+ start:260 stop:496 length:237 start_codon:yes stop_codon:yes gene_type:complete
MLIFKKIYYLNNEKNRFLLFLICIGLLLPAPLFSGILFFILLLLNSKNILKNYIKDKWNLPLFFLLSIYANFYFFAFR